MKDISIYVALKAHLNRETMIVLSDDHKEIYNECCFLLAPQESQCFSDYRSMRLETGESLLFMPLTDQQGLCGTRADMIIVDQAREKASDELVLMLVPFLYSKKRKSFDFALSLKEKDIGMPDVCKKEMHSEIIWFKDLI